LDGVYVCFGFLISMNRMPLLPGDPIQFSYSSADIQSVSKGLAVAKNMDAFRGKSYYDNSGNQVISSTGVIDLGSFRGGMSQQAYLISPPSTFEAMKCIAYANGVWLIGGARAGTSINNILRSTDGFTWTAVNTPTAVGNASVGFVPTGFAYGNSIWVACGNYSNTSIDDVLIKSTDNGLTWTKLGNPKSAANSPYSITYGNKWVVASEYFGGLVIFYSTDASTWSVVTFNTNSYRVDISSTNLTYLNNPLRSYASFILSVKKVVSGVVGDCQLLTSTDGVAWTEVTTPPGIITIYSITMGGAYSNTTTFYISAKWKIGNTYYFGYYLSFFDGQLFSYYLSDSYNSTQDFTTMSSMIKGGNYFILTGGLDSRSFYIEPDNVIAYNQTYRSTYGGGQSIAYGNNMFIQVNNTSSMMIINPLRATWNLVWTPSTNNPFSSGSLQKVAWNGSYFVAVGIGTDSSAAKSFDGSSWTTSIIFGPPITGGWNIAWNGSYWIALASPNNNRTIFKSSDGLTWTASNNNPFGINTPSGIVWNGSYWLAVSFLLGTNTGTVAKSLNGMDWTNIATLTYGLLHTIAWNGSYWLIGCSENDANNSINIIKSSDGVTWTPSINNPFRDRVNIIVWNGSYWLAGGRGTKTCSTSTDGMNWATTSTVVFTGTNDMVYDLAWNGYYWVAVGNNSTFTTYISTSLDGLYWTPSSSDPFNGGGFAYGIAWNGSYFVMGGRARTASNKNIATSYIAPLQAITVSTLDSGSFTLLADYILISYEFSDGSDLDTRTRVTVPFVGSYLGYGQVGVDSSILTWGGDNTGTGVESCLIDLLAFKNSYPTNNTISIECRAHWFAVVGTNVNLRITLFKGGTMIKSGYGWINTTATTTTILSSVTKAIPGPLKTPAEGTYIGTLSYNVNTNSGGVSQ